MKQYMKWAFVAVLLLLVSCVKSEKFSDESLLNTPGVYGFIPQPVSDDPGTKATFSPDMLFSFQVGDHINIWSEEGTLLIYTAKRLSGNGGAIFDGGGFNLVDGMTYYSSFPLLSSFLDDMTTVPFDYGGQVQTADGDASHVADRSVLYTSATCNAGSASFAYQFLCRWVKFTLTLPETTMTVKELSLVADSPVFTLEGTADITTATPVITPAVMTDTMTLEFDDVTVTDGELNAFMAISTYVACNVVVKVKDAEGKVYVSDVIAQNNATTPGNFRRITTTLAEQTDVAAIGSVTYPTLAAAIAAVPTDGTATTITMIGDETIVGWRGVTIDEGKNIILELNGHSILQTGPMYHYSHLIENYGTLTIKDNSDTAADGTGTGMISCSAADPSTGLGSAFSSQIVVNYGTLNVESGCLQITNGLAADYVNVVENYPGATINLTGGKLKSLVNKNILVQMFLNSTVDANTLNIGGTAVLEGYVCVMMEYWTNYANKGVLNITGGTLNATDRAVMTNPRSSDVTKDGSRVSIDISGGTFLGTGVFLDSETPFQSIVVTGGHFAYLNVPASGGTAFIAGGEYETVEGMAEGRLPSQSAIAAGYKVVYEGGLYYVVPGNDPRPEVNLYEVVPPGGNEGVGGGVDD